MTLGSFSHSKGSVAHVQNRLHRGEEDLKQEGRSLSVSQSSHRSFPKLAQAAPSLTRFAFGFICAPFSHSPDPPKRSAFPPVRRQTDRSPCCRLGHSQLAGAVLPCPPGHRTFRGRAAPGMERGGSSAALPAGPSLWISLSSALQAAPLTAAWSSSGVPVQGSLQRLLLL